MAHVSTIKSSFAAGELAGDLLGRTDLRAYENGARTLRNVFVHPTGAVSRRAGLRFVDTARGPGRLLAFEFNTEQVYLLVLTDRALDIYRGDSRIANLAAPWTAAQIQQLNWTQSADTLLFVHPDVAPKRLTRLADGRWDLADWTVATMAGNRLAWPHVKFAAPSVTLQFSGYTGNIVVGASAPVFVAQHVGARLRFNGRELLITGYAAPTHVNALVIQEMVNPFITTDWTEQAWSNARGWPVAVCFHQDRLVVGGSRDLPHQLWLSRTSQFFNFDTGEGLDDEAIEFPILSDQLNAVRHVFSGRHLQVFTSGAEWMVSGMPLTPTNVQVHRQTRIGSPVDRTVPPRDVDGATLFLSRSGAQLREFLFTDAEQAYQAGDLSLVASHLLKRPVDMDFDKTSRLFHVVLTDGTLATVTIYRDEAVTAWSLQTTQGAFRSVAVVGDRVCFLMERAGGFFVEVFDPGLFVDCGLTGTRTPATATWSGLGHLEGQWVTVLADGVALPGTKKVAGGSVTIDRAAKTVAIGLSYTHVIEPLPPVIEGRPMLGRLRPLSITVRLRSTGAMCIDTGKGRSYVPLASSIGGSPSLGPELYSGDKRIRVAGWRQGQVDALWRIEQEVPLPLTLLLVTVDLSIND